MAMYNDGLIPSSYICDDAIEDYGYVLTLKTTGNVGLCAADGAAFGVAYMSTKEKKGMELGNAIAGEPVAVVQGPRRYAYVRYNLASTDDAISITNLVSMKGANAPGCVKRHAATANPDTYLAATADVILDEYKTIVGIAMEAVAAPLSGSKTGVLKVLLLCPMVPHQLAVS